jgi:hypothetical protein
LIATNYELLYRGGDEALCWHEREGARVSRTLILRSGSGKGFMLVLRAAATLAAWSSGPRKGNADLLASARALIGELATVRNAFAGHTAPFLMAQVHVLEGKRELALAALRRVDAAALQCGIEHLAHRAQYLQAVLEGGDSGRQRRSQLLAVYAQQGWKQPHRALALVCPILSVLEGDGEALAPGRT